MSEPPATPAAPAAPPKPTWDPIPGRGGAAPALGYPWLRPTIRIRLTLLYGGMFLMAGMVLLTIIYLLAAQALHDGGAANVQLVYGDNIRVESLTPCAEKQFAQRAGITSKFEVSIADFNKIQSTCIDAQRSHALDSLLRRSLLSLLGLTVLAFALGYLMAGRVLAPLGRITRTARSVAGSDLHKRIELDGPDDELKELSDTFDDMLDRLDRAFNAQQRFVANASHELRTPLAINRTLLEVQLSDPEASAELTQLGKTLLATNERSEQLVEGLLLLARSENQIVDRKPVDLAEVASQAVDQVRGEAEKKGVELRGVRHPAYVQGNGVLLERVALNLLQNAVRYNVQEEGWVEVDTRTVSDQPGLAVLTVANTGPVVPAYEVDALFEPFRRLRTERTGSDRGVGLGLSIVRSVTRAHGGTVTAEPREGGGLVIRVTLPV
ncbi:sensor histidine kinase [Streptomyces polyrhachis]|uniref:histidine kinase n=1 Tax=Streptomyces polyrhachis TaxID=1282885 RepID=A0ABW2GFP7_9ACTN